MFCASVNIQRSTVCTRQLNNKLIMSTREKKRRKHLLQEKIKVSKCYNKAKLSVCNLANKFQIG